jgi:formylmethanofuran dehydrogenase subunit B
VSEGLSLCTAAGGSDEGVRTLNDAVISSLRVIEDATCLGCACLCDDIGAVVEGDRLVEARNACQLGREWYGVGEPIHLEPPRIDGRSVDLEAALDRAAELLGAARAPLVWGLTRSTVETQRHAVAIADRIGGFVGISGAGSAGAMAYQRVGHVSATLGEVRDRADIIVYDFHFPMHKFPRLSERYAENSTGRFVSDGRDGRTVIRLALKNEKLAMADADAIIRIPAAPSTYDHEASPAEFYAALRAVIKGFELNTDRLARLGLDLSVLMNLATQLKRAKYGALFLSDRSATTSEWEAILGLVRDLNAYTRFVVLNPTPDAPNAAGAKSVLSWQTSAVGEVDFSMGSPRYDPLEETTERLMRGEFDAALLVCEGTATSSDMEWLTYDRKAALSLSRLPRIVIRPADSLGANWTKRGVPYSINSILYEPHVSIPTARPGIDEGGTFARFDGVMLPLRPLFPGRRVSQAEVLRLLEARLKERGH